MNKSMTIGELAKKVGLRTSALRYYEEQGLLQPVDRSEAGYRLYDTTAEQSLRFIQRAQRLGFSLADIRVLLQAWQQDELDNETVLVITQERYLELERQMTQSLVLQHELGLFLQDLRDDQDNQQPMSDTFNQLLDRVCANPLNQPNADDFNWFLAQSGCALNTPEGRALLEPLRGQHVHVWQGQDGYHILVVSRDPLVGQALAELARLEAHCQIHAQQHSAPQIAANDEGFLFIVQGENAFIYVRLFLMLEEMGR